jgi:hypothetical protein
MPADILGYCGRCGAPFGVGAGAFCPRCGNRIVPAPAAAMGYTYPVLPAAAVPAAIPRFSRLRLFVIAGAILAVAVVLVTLIAVLARPLAPKSCGFYCGPRLGTRLQSQTVYQNQKWGYSVEYLGNVMLIAGQNQDGVQFVPADGDGEIDFAATSGSDAGAAVQTAINNLPSATFQQMTLIGPVRGAEIGFVPGQGQAYSAEFVAPGTGGSATPVSIVVMAAAHNGMTITVTAFSMQTTMDPPFQLDKGTLFDYEASNTVWK